MKINAFLALLLLFCILLPALAQTKPAAPTPPQNPSEDDVVRITTNLVQVDAVVTKDGKPVNNLTADDFEIYEDGRKQAITSFAYVSNLSNTQPVAKTRDKNAEVVPFAPLKANDPRRTVAFVVDDLGLSAESMAQVRRQLRKFLVEQIQPNDLIAIMRTSGELGALQQFTNDRRLLNRSVDQLRWNICSRVGINLFPTMRGDGPFRDDDGSGSCYGRSYYQTMKALRFILDAMAQIPGRKSMVLMSDSIPMESQEVRFNDDSLNSFRGVGAYSYASLLQRVAEKAIRASVVIYSVDTQGLAYTGVTAADRFGDNPRNMPRSLPMQINDLMSSRAQLMFSRREGGELIARQTGGFQIRNSNYFELNRIMEDQSGYYLIGYRPTDETFNKKFHHIKAKVKRSGMTLRTRFGFLGVSEEEASKNRPPVINQTNLALASPFGAQDIEMDVTSFFANDKTYGSIVRSFVYINARNLTFTSNAGRREAAIELNGVIFGDNGSVIEQVSRRANLSLSEVDYEQAISNGMGLTFDIPVKKPGFYQVRIAARDKASSQIGSTGQFVMVPDLTTKKLAVSGIVLGTMADSSVNNISVETPGAKRFITNSNLYFAFMLYNADGLSQPANLVMQAKVFRDGKTVYSGPETPIQFANQPDPSRVFTSGSVRLSDDLGPGDYYLQIVITDKGAKSKTAPVAQWIDFQIVK